MNITFTNSLPWFKSREVLCLKIILESFILLFLLNYSLYFKDFEIWKLFYLIFHLISWITFSYIFGRYEIDKNILKINLFNQLYKSLITGITFFSINEFLGLILILRLFPLLFSAVK